LKPTAVWWMLLFPPSSAFSSNCSAASANNQTRDKRLYPIFIRAVFLNLVFNSGSHLGKA
jgi:hypothetical protein